MDRSLTPEPAMASACRPMVFHVDMDAFFASVEQRDHPHYRNKPVIVGAKPGSRGVVSAASYEARTFGIHSAMPISEAYSRCPGAVFVRPRMKVYEAVSDAIMKIFLQFSPVVEQVSVDEAFLDMAGTDRLFGPPETAGRLLADTVFEKQQLTASIGIAPNKFCAKVASDMHKPGGITRCPDAPQAIVRWLAPMQVNKIWGIGKKTAQILARMGIMKVSDLQELSLERLVDRFGKQGSSLYHLSRGIDHRPVDSGTTYKSISHERTFSADSNDPERWRRTLFSLSQDVARRARRYGVKGNTVFITYRSPDFSRHTRQKNLQPPTSVARFIFEGAKALLEEVTEKSLRLLGVGISGFETPLQTELFNESGPLRQWEDSEHAVDLIAERFGSRVIRKGRELGE